MIAVIGNDACWTQILREQQPMLGDDVACQLSYTEYDVVAKGYGGEGYSVRDIGNVKKVLERALKTAREKKIPVCVNALIGSTDFREGSISVWLGDDDAVNIFVVVFIFSNNTWDNGDSFCCCVFVTAYEIKHM